MLWSAVPSPGAATEIRLLEMGDSASEGLTQEQNVQLASCLDKFLLKQEEVMARMSFQQQQLDDTIATLKSEVRGPKRRRETQDSQAVPSASPAVVGEPVKAVDSMPNGTALAPVWQDRFSNDDVNGANLNALASAWMKYNKRQKNYSSLSFHIKKQQKKGPIMQRIVASSTFDTICALMVLANTILIGVETELMTYDFDKHRETIFFIQLALNCWFTAELVLRLVGEGPVDFLTGEDWRWNLFDSIICATSIVDIIISSTMSVSYDEEGGVPVSGGTLKAIRLMRVVRSLRLARALKTFREFRKMIYALQASIQTVCWSLLLFFCIMYCFAILFTQAACEYLHRLPEDERELERNIDVQESYGNLTRSFYSLYLAISDGKSWGLCLAPLMEIDEFMAGLFLLYVSVVLFGVTNVITAVFVESAMSSAQYYKELIIEDTLRAKEIAVQHMRQVFSVIDEDRSGVIDATEFEHLLKDPSVQVYLESLEISAEDTGLLFRLLDRDDSGDIDVDEFCAGCFRLKGDAKNFDIHVLLSQVTKSINMIERIRRDLDVRLNRKVAWETETRESQATRNESSVATRSDSVVATT